MKIVFFGTSAFSVTILQHLFETSHCVVAIVTKPDQPKGRSLKLTPPPLKEWACVQAPSIPLYQPFKASNDEFVALMHSFDPDLFVVASYGEIMKSPLLKVPRLGPINVHASLLPKWRGAAPIQRSLMAGEQATGVTLIQMVLQLDAGDMLDHAKVGVPLEMNHGELEHALGLASKEPLLRVLSHIERGEVKAIPQDPLQATFAPKITSSDLFIEWNRSAFEIHNQIRALSPEPGAWTWVKIGVQTKKLKIKRSSIQEKATSLPKETFLLTEKQWAIGCTTDVLHLLEVQLEGKKSLPIADFLRGLHHLPQIL